ncbi:unnamed protein product, partial [Aphanomyces euteiches]
NEDTTRLKVRRLFDTVIEKFPTAAHYLATTSAIVKNANFENEVVKILGQLQASMSDGEEKSVSHLLVNDAATLSDDQSDAMMSLVERSKVTANSYMDCRFIQPMSNMCERLFFG